MTGAVLGALDQEVAKGTYRADPLQREVAAKLDEVASRLELTPAQDEKRSLWSRWSSKPAATPAPKGLYVHGGVGRGKSMLMDLFFDAVPLDAKRRVHFHAFMLEIQKRLTDLRKAGGSVDPLEKVGEEIAGQARLLCFDEFHVLNIADAMILGRLFTVIFDAGTLVVATSNWPPDRLYENGLNRDRFLPFIELLKSRVDNISLDGPTDYRLERLREAEIYLTPLGDETTARMNALFEKLGNGSEPRPSTITVGSRILDIPQTTPGVARFDFADLCEKPLGAQDYLELTEIYHTLIIDVVPKLDAAKRNEARRLMTLIDVLYERQMIMVMSAAEPPHELYQAEDGAFEFQRTVSRLMEMQSSDYLKRCRGRDLTQLPQKVTPFALTSDLI